MEIPAGVEKINPFAFQGLNCKMVNIGEDVNEIGIHAFSHSTLEQLNMNQNLTKIGDYAYCPNLEKVILPSTINFVDIDFYELDNLTTMIVKSLIPPKGGGNWNPKKSYSWDDGVSKSICTLYVPAESLELYKTSEDWKDFKEILPIENL